MEIKEKIVNITNQKNIALSFLNNPTKKKHFKAIIAVHKQYENAISDIFKLNCNCDFYLRESNRNITHTFVCDNCRKSED